MPRPQAALGSTLCPVMHLIPTGEELGSAAANVYDKLVRGGLADTRPMPASIIDEGRMRTVYRYARVEHAPHRRSPVLLVPPLAAPAICFDLRRGNSLAEHLLHAGHPTYLLDYGPVQFADRDLGLEHWIEDVIPTAVRVVAADAGGEPVQIVGWCLGGIMSLLVAADRQDLPLRSLALVASPFDVTAVPMVAPLRPITNVAGGSLVTALYRMLGGAPAPIVKRAYQLAGIDKYVMKPYVIARNLDDRELLAQIEAVDRFTNRMLAYPGRTFGQLYHRFFRSNDLAAGFLDVGGRRIELADVAQPVLSVAGSGDGIAPERAVRHVADLLPGAAEVRLETCPGGHLGVLTGRAAKRTMWPLLDAWLREDREPAAVRPGSIAA